MHAGGPRSRRGGRGGALLNGGCVKSWRSMRLSVATSSGEGELYAMPSGHCEGLGLKPLKDLEWRDERVEV